MKYHVIEGNVALGYDMYNWKYKGKRNTFK